MLEKSECEMRRCQNYFGLSVMNINCFRSSFRFTLSVNITLALGFVCLHCNALIQNRHFFLAGVFIHFFL